MSCKDIWEGEARDNEIIKRGEASRRRPVHGNTMTPAEALERLVKAAEPFTVLNLTELDRIEREHHGLDGPITVTLVTQKYVEGSQHRKLEYATELGHVTVYDLKRLRAALAAVAQGELEPNRVEKLSALLTRKDTELLDARAAIRLAHKMIWPKHAGDSAYHAWLDLPAVQAALKAQP